jgi:hypothetical protein
MMPEMARRCSSRARPVREARSVGPRTARGRLPDCTEVFIDEGDADMLEALRISRRNG